MNDDGTARLLERIQAFVLDDPRAKLPFSSRLAKEQGWSHAKAGRVVTEYKRFRGRRRSPRSATRWRRILPSASSCRTFPHRPPAALPPAAPAVGVTMVAEAAAAGEHAVAVAAGVGIHLQNGLFRRGDFSYGGNMKGAEYMMILRNTDWDGGLSIEQVAETIASYEAWIGRLVGEGIVTGGRPLFSGGKVLAMGKGGETVDGPFVETKEVIGGYILLQAASFEDAAEIAKTFPPLERGVEIELRELAIECPVSQRHAERVAERAMAAP